MIDDRCKMSFFTFQFLLLTIQLRHLGAYWTYFWRCFVLIAYDLWNILMTRLCRQWLNDSSFAANDIFLNAELGRRREFRWRDEEREGIVTNYYGQINTCHSSAVTSIDYATPLATHRLRSGQCLSLATCHLPLKCSHTFVTQEQ